MARIRLLFIALSVFQVAFAVQAADPPKVTPELRQRALEILERNLDQEDRSSKTLAARFLLSLGYLDRAESVFQRELEQSGDEVAYRIDIWSVLARSVEGERRRPWIEEILAVALDAESTDRVHAAQVLGELGDGLPEESLKKLDLAARAAEGPWQVYLQWVRLNSGREDAEATLALALASPEPAVRAAATCSLRHRQQVSEATRRELASAAEREPTDSPVRASLVAAAAVHASGESQERFRQQLANCAQTGTETERFLAYHTMAGTAAPGDLPLLVAGLEDRDGQVASAAAWSVLRVERRVSHRLVGLDWAVIGAYVVMLLAIGWYYSRLNITRDEYLLGNRRLKPLNVGLSLFATLLSTISYLAWPGEMIKYGPMMNCIYFAHPLTYLVVGYLMIPFIMKLKVTSAYEILENRLGLAVRMLGSFFFLALRLGWMAVIVYATTSKVLVPLIGLPQAMTPWLCAILGLIAIIYTSMGGIRAMVVIDVIQTAILFAAAIVTMVVVTVKMGGVTAWWPTDWAPHWPEPVWIYSNTARVTALGAAFSTFVWWVCTTSSDQMAVQRYLSTRDAKAARRVMAVTLVSDFVVGMFLSILGLALLGFFRANPQLLPDSPLLISDADQLFPRFIVFGLPAGLSGLAVAGLLAAAMSSLSAGLSSSCSVITVDFIDRFRRDVGRGVDQVRTAKLASIVVGIVVVLLSTLVSVVQGNLLEVCYKVVNLLTAPLFGLFFMAMFVRWATGFGTIVGALAGVVVVVAVNYWEEFTGTKGISFLWAMPLSLATQIVVGSLASLLPIGRRAPVPMENPSSGGDL